MLSQAWLFQSGRFANFKPEICIRKSPPADWQVLRLENDGGASRMQL
jgi:hypothetical protein